MKKSQLFCLFGILFVFGMGLSTTHAAAPMDVQLRFDAAGRFKIVQFTDLHLNRGGAKDRRTMALVEEILDSEKPQLVVLTGDVLSGTAKRREMMALCAGPMAERKIPWAVALGNHDDERPKDSKKPKDRRGLMDIIMSLPYSVSQQGPKDISGVSNYTLPILASAGPEKKWVLYFLDSNAYAPKKELGSYDWIKTDQVGWYNETSRTLAKERAGGVYPALAFFHIPLMEYEYALSDSNAHLVGHRAERVCCPRINSGLFAAMLERGDVKGTFVGHDHVNDYEAELHGIRLIYGRATGFDTYGREGFPRGGRVILIKENAQTFTTWLRLEGGTKVQY